MVPRSFVPSLLSKLQRTRNRLSVTVPSSQQVGFKCSGNVTQVDIASSFKSSELKLSLAGPEILKPKPVVARLGFGKCFTDHMFEVEWDSDTGWTRPLISPFHDISIHPASKVLHYAIQLYEGMKAYRGVDGRIRLFRPHLNINRLLRGARRSLLPEFDPEEFLACLKTLIRIEEGWVPHSETSSLYIRPTFIGTEPSLGIARSLKALLFVIMCPVGPYFETGLKPIALLADPQYVRAWPGGCGDIKLGSNYGPTVFVQKCAEAEGLQQVLWLFGEEHLVTEVGTMNIFLLMRNRNGEKGLITPPLNGLILPGVTRQSILDLCRHWNEVKVTERFMSMKEVVKLCNEKRLLECFAAGTACTVCPVHRISYLGKDYHIPTVEQPDPLCILLLNHLSAVYFGRLPHEWAELVD